MRVLVFGTFDLLHPGHLYVFKEAKARGDAWAVVARDETVQKIKGRAPVENEEVRVKAVEKILGEGRVLLGDLTDYRVPLRIVRPDLILLGYDQKLPPGLTEADLPCPIERLEAKEPEKYKSSKFRREE